MKPLLLLQLRGMLASLLYTKSDDPSRRRPVVVALISLCLLFCCGSFVLLFVSMFYMMGSALVGTENAWLYWAFLGVMVFALDFISTVFLAKKQLFEAEDNEALLSLPLRPRDILLSRMLVILISNYFFALLCAVPAAGVWLFLGGFTPLGALFTLLCFLVLPLFALSLAALVGWLLSLLTARIKNKSLFTTIFSLLFLFGYFALMENIEGIIEGVINHADQVAEGMKTIFYPFFCFGMASMGKALYALLFLLMMVLPFLLTVWILSRTFLSLATRQHTVSDNRVYKRKKQTQKTLRKTLLVRELRHLGASSTYMLNSGLGLIFVLVVAIGAPFLFSALPPVEGEEGMLLQSFLGSLGITAISFTLSTILFTAPSISLEGETLWQLQSLPVRGRDILRGKLDMHLCLTAPITLIASLSLGIFVAKGPLMFLMTLVVPQVLNYAFALFGLWMGLLFPRLDWTSEAVVVKQSLSTFLAMLGNMLIVGAYSALALPLDLILFAGAGQLLALLLFGGLTFLLHYLLLRWGEKKLTRLGA